MKEQEKNPNYMGADNCPHCNTNQQEYYRQLRKR